MQWALLGLAGIAGYFLAAEPVIDRVRALSGKASDAERRLRDYAEKEARLRAADESVRLGEQQFGVVELPGDPEQRPLAFGKAVDEVVRKHGVSNVTSTTRTQPMSTGELTKFVEKEQTRVERSIKELTFLATPEALGAILADLEREPLVTTISRVEARQSEGNDKVERLLRVRIAAESWVLAKKGGTR
jgi:hypothetical protein